MSDVIEFIIYITWIFLLIADMISNRKTRKSNIETIEEIHKSNDLFKISKENTVILWLVK